ncbi:hypothetical protein PMAYCL1PPCAC_07941, partial [Pristionchus mayeri]
MNIVLGQSLLLDHLEVLPPSGDQFFVSTPLHYPTSLHEADLVSVSDRIQSMGDHHRCSSVSRGLEGHSNHLLALRVQCTGCLIEYDYFRFPHECSRN